MNAGQTGLNLVGRTVAEVERDLILETLKHCLGNRTHAARSWGMSIARCATSRSINTPVPACRYPHRAAAANCGARRRLWAWTSRQLRLSDSIRHPAVAAAARVVSAEVWRLRGPGFPEPFHLAELGKSLSGFFEQPFEHDALAMGDHVRTAGRPSVAIRRRQARRQTSRPAHDLERKRPVNREVIEHTKLVLQRTQGLDKLSRLLAPLLAWSQALRRLGRVAQLLRAARNRCSRRSSSSLRNFPCLRTFRRRTSRAVPAA